jgi:putative pre-16S rRNA nuclease
MKQTDERMDDAAREASAYPPPRLSGLPREGRLLAVDWGAKRVGLAISDPTQTIAQPLGTLTRRAGKRFPMGQLKTYLDREPPVGVVVGLPLDGQGGEGPAAREARASGALIAAKTGLPVAYWDERMSTARVVKDRGAEGRAVADALAATVILQTFLDGRRP